jgi:hypothetical protein
MHDIFSREPDPLDGMLRPPSLPENEALHQAVYCRTRRVLQRRHCLRQFTYAASLLVSFAAGSLAMWVILPAHSASKETPLPAPIASKEEIPPAPPDVSALASEWIAFDSEDHRGELYRQAGDHYMTEEVDPQSALRCYSNALDSGTEQDLAISTDDDWLLMAIKNARQKEKKHANQDG